jgi:hypothetical protein
VDQVGMSAGSAYGEGTRLAPLTTNVDRSYERRPGGTSGGDKDTGDNAADFQVITPSDPQNAQSTCIQPTPVTEPTWGRIKMMYR